MIQHGIPNHKFFAIALPPSDIKPMIEELDPEYKKRVLELQDPKSLKKYKAELHGTWTVTLDELELMNSFCLLVYGLNSKKISNELRKKYLEIEETQRVRFLLLKKI